jgi:hypothetical protein
MISVLVSSFWIDDGKPEILKNCLNSLVGADEVLSLVTHKNTPLGYADAWNRLASLAKGDYLVFLGDNSVQIKGNLQDLAIKGTVTCPVVNEQQHPFSGFVFCLPRTIYEEFGLYDMRYNNGSHWEDTDLWRTYKVNNIRIKTIESVGFSKLTNGRTIFNIPNSDIRIANNMKAYKEKWGDNLGIN